MDKSFLNGDGDKGYDEKVVDDGFGGDGDGDVGDDNDDDDYGDHPQRTGIRQLLKC